MDAAETDRRVREIERHIDDAYRDQTLLKSTNRPAAQWYLLLQHEECIRVPLLFRPHEIDETEIEGRIEHSKGALQYALRWTDSLPESRFKPPSAIDWDTYRQANELFMLGMDYHGVIAPFVFYSRGLAHAQIEGPHTVRFSRDERDIVFDALDQMIKRTLAPRQTENCVPPSGAVREMETVFGTAKSNNGSTITYKATHKNYRPFVDHFADRIASSSRLGADWSLLGIWAKELRRFLATLKAICHIHHNCVANAARRLELQGGAPASAVFVRSEAEWVKILTRASSLPEDAVARMVDMCRYDREELKRDVSLSPLFPLNQRIFALCPLLVEFGDLERNFLALAARRFKKDFDLASDTFELRMIGICRELAARNGFRFASRSQVSVDSQRTDVDVAFFEADTNCLLLAQLKSVTPPSEPAEILERGEREGEALRQAAVVRELVRKSPETIWTACYPDLTFPSPEVFHCVLLQSSVGSPRCLDAGIPSLDLAHFERLCEEFGTLKDLCEHVSAFGHLPERGTDFEVREVQLSFGPYTIVWEGFELPGEPLFPSSPR